jgi:5-methylcytosine-specific restriction endonuclease McrA
MRWWLVMLLAIAFCCSFVAPDSGLHKSALQAFDSSVGMQRRAGVEQSATSRREGAKRGEDEPGIAGRAEGSFRGSVSASAPQLRSFRAAPRPTHPLRTSSIRKRVTPLMQKRVAARYGFKCAICGLPLTDSSLWEIDHIVPLSSARTAVDVARLNDISNLQPVHRSPCHQMKTSREPAAR